MCPTGMHETHYLTIAFEENVQVKITVRIYEVLVHRSTTTLNTFDTQRFKDELRIIHVQGASKRMQQIFK